MFASGDAGSGAGGSDRGIGVARGWNRTRPLLGVAVIVVAVGRGVGVVGVAAEGRGDGS